MAGADYKSCDVCGGKAFYDAKLQYEQEDKWNKETPFSKEVGETLSKFEAYKLGHLGDWAVLCVNCAKTHKTQIVPIEG